MSVIRDCPRSTRSVGVSPTLNPDYDYDDDCDDDYDDDYDDDCNATAYPLTVAPTTHSAPSAKPMASRPTARWGCDDPPHNIQSPTRAAIRLPSFTQLISQVLQHNPWVNLHI